MWFSNGRRELEDYYSTIRLREEDRELAIELSRYLERREPRLRKVLRESLENNSWEGYAEALLSVAGSCDINPREKSVPRSFVGGMLFAPAVPLLYTSVAELGSGDGSAALVNSLASLAFVSSSAYITRDRGVGKYRSLVSRVKERGYERLRDYVAREIVSRASETQRYHGFPAGGSRGS